jgi:hypothetical protein
MVRVIRTLAKGISNFEIPRFDHNSIFLVPCSILKNLLVKQGIKKPLFRW